MYLTVACLLTIIGCVGLGLSPAVGILSSLILWFGFGALLLRLSARQRRLIADFFKSNAPGLKTIEQDQASRKNMMLAITISNEYDPDQKTYQGHQHFLLFLYQSFFWPNTMRLIDTLRDLAVFYGPNVIDDGVKRILNKIVNAGLPATIDIPHEASKGLTSDGVWVHREPRNPAIVTVAWVRIRSAPEIARSKFKALTTVLSRWGGEDIILVNEEEAGFVWRSGDGAEKYLGAVRSLAIYAPFSYGYHCDPFSFIKNDLSGLTSIYLAKVKLFQKPSAIKGGEYAGSTNRERAIQDLIASYETK